MSTTAPQVAQKDKPSIWQQILSEASWASKQDSSTLLVLGRSGVGKKHLIRALERESGMSTDDMYEGNLGVSTLDYAYLNVRNLEEGETTESIGKTNLWILEDPEHKSLLASRLKADMLGNLGVMICVDLKRPWTIMDDVSLWRDLASEVISPLYNQLPLDSQDELKKKLRMYVANYEETCQAEQNENEGGKMNRRAGTQNFEQATQLDDNVLKLNLGVPIIVCVCKADTHTALDSRQTQGHNDVVLAHLRAFCLQLGAALIYTTANDVRTQKNVDSLCRYMMHRLHGFPARMLPITGERETIFWPSGFDKFELVTEFATKSCQGGLERPFDTVVVRPPSKMKDGGKGGMEVPVETVEAFLEKAMSQLQSGGGGAARRKEERTRQPAAARMDPSAAARAGAAGVPPGAAGDNGSLANFFQTLLAKGQERQGRPTTPRGERGGGGGGEKEGGGSAEGASKSAEKPAEKPAAPEGGGGGRKMPHIPTINIPKQPES
uniref:Dynein light intermediate chain n=1 Tax=Chromera velia CCMP2878 TaxID=1169474 RepID=A0A0G4G2K2_9ALVE|eukprot:Cvel_4111.t1-p1 / transcript=Cvel_4111.t1 / gene=Cvel_4111 / organism=Chromera_velia_CCMP2878 / gene_product=Cytoplasmic dynein 1 light intermediate chain 2, putative / transcript_product=Cytoplasmic dynein 1 light intermediate chain 2, putative / location=Cvel_scaffold175:72052-80398(-) / protein_length=493 / sequence_SO=supercontig / SO=protein_coding / is_pseudo=false